MAFLLMGEGRDIFILHELLVGPISFEAEVIINSSVLKILRMFACFDNYD